MGVRDDIEVGLDNLSIEIAAWSHRKGWRKPEPRNPLELCSLIHTEVSELVEAFRHHNPPCEKVGLEHISAAEEEVADIVIRLADFCDEHGLRFGYATVEKMRYNDNREHRHGGKAY